MNKDYYPLTSFDSHWVMEQLESQLAMAELAGEGDLPDWAVF